MIARRMIYLTARQHEVLVLIAQGRQSKEIQTILGIGGSTVSKHREDLCSKLNAHSTAELVILAFELGVVTPAARRLVPVRNGRVLRYLVPSA